jgi:hypothetical protein
MTDHILLNEALRSDFDEAKIANLFVRTFEKAMLNILIIQFFKQHNIQGEQYVNKMAQTTIEDFFRAADEKGVSISEDQRTRFTEGIDKALKQIKYTLQLDKE